jgi:hypothetical protein
MTGPEGEPEMTRRVRAGKHPSARRIGRLTVAAATLLALSSLGVSAAQAATLTPPPPGGADCQTNPSGTVCSWIESFATPFPVPYGVTCSGFSVLVHLAGERHVTAFYDENGALAQRIRHSSYVGTLRNSVTGATVPHIGHFTIFDDLAARTSTITGTVRGRRAWHVGCADRSERRRRAVRSPRLIGHSTHEAPTIRRGLVVNARRQGIRLHGSAECGHRPISIRADDPRSSASLTRLRRQGSPVTIGR